MYTHTYINICMSDPCHKLPVLVHPLGRAASEGISKKLQPLETVATRSG